MNALGTALVWGGLQAAIFACLGALVYLMVRWRAPAAGSFTALAVLLLAAGISAFAFCPWPRWWSLQADFSSMSGVTTANVDAAQGAPESPKSDGQAGTNQNLADKLAKSGFDPDKERMAVVRAAVGGFLNGLRDSPSNSHDSTWRWPVAAAVALLLGMGLGLLRLVLGLAAVARYRMKSWPIADAELLASIDKLAAESGCARRIEIRESGLLDAPATIGWLRPLILVPLDWRTWSLEERMAVLAHEVVHIQRRDYAAWIAAQLSLACHFYNPLMHWLVGRLRLEQELAADRRGAQAVGGSELYAIALARLALRLDNRAASWAARPFLPARGTLIRRIEMLREWKAVDPAPLRTRGKALLLGALAVLGILVAGLRGPLAGKAPGEDKPGGAASAVFDLTLVPNDAALLLALRPADLVKHDKLGEFAKSLVASTGMDKNFATALPDVEELLVTLMDVPPASSPDRSGLILIRSNKDGAWAEVMERAKSSSDVVSDSAIGDKKYFRAKAAAPGGPPPECFALLNARTLLIGAEPLLRKALQSAGKSPPAPAWANDWKNVATGQVAIMLDMDRVRKALQEVAKKEPDALVKLGLLAPLWQKTNRLFVGARAGKDLSFQAQAICSTDDDAKQVLQTTQAIKIFAENLLDQAAKPAQGGPRPAPAELIELARALLKQTRLEQKNNSVEVRVALAGEAMQKLAVVTAQGVVQARAAAARQRSMGHMKQILLAMHNYHDTYGRFPAAAQIGPDGKTRHSWRVAILPFLEQAQLYQEYKLNEPWDSENNKKVLAKMPSVYEAVEGGPGNTSSYFALTGPDPIFSGKEGTKLQEISDGTSNTIMVVEAKRDIPWTKPEDIVYAADKPLPKFGGFAENGFNAAFADGSVRFISNTIDEKILRALITKARGEPIPQF